MQANGPQVLERPATEAKRSRPAAPAEPARAGCACSHSGARTHTLSRSVEFPRLRMTARRRCASRDDGARTAARCPAPELCSDRHQAVRGGHAAGHWDPALRGRVRSSALHVPTTHEWSEESAVGHPCYAGHGAGTDTRVSSSVTFGATSAFPLSFWGEVVVMAHAGWRTNGMSENRGAEQERKNVSKQVILV